MLSKNNNPLSKPLDAESLMWVSVKRFNKLTGWPIDKIIEACIAEGLIAEKVFVNHGKEYRISVKNLSVSALKKHVSEEIDKAHQWKAELLAAQKHLNAISYACMKDFEKKSVDRWLPVMVETGSLKGKLLKEYLKVKSIPYITFWRYRKKWSESGGDINSLKTNYSHNKYKKTEGK